MVAIKEMSMPKYCNDCDFVIDSMGYCERANEQIPNYDFYSETNEKPDFCPLIEIGTCKDCKYYRNMDKYSYCTKRLNVDSVTDRYREPNFYCADFEKRDNNKPKTYIDCQKCENYRNPDYSKCMECGKRGTENENE